MKGITTSSIKYILVALFAVAALNAGNVQFLSVPKGKANQLNPTAQRVYDEFASVAASKSVCQDKVKQTYVTSHLPSYNVVLLYEDGSPSSSVAAFYGFAFFKRNKDDIYIDTICGPNLKSINGDWQPGGTIKGSGTAILYYINNLAKKEGKKYLSLNSIKNADTFNWYLANNFYVNTDSYNIETEDGGVRDDMNFIELADVFARDPDIINRTGPGMLDYDHAKKLRVSS